MIIHVKNPNAPPLWEKLTLTHLCGHRRLQDVDPGLPLATRMARQQQAGQEECPDCRQQNRRDAHAALSPEERRERARRERAELSDGG